METLSFRNGDEMPILGLGTWKSAPGDVYDAVKIALQAGYRHIDCALIYGNEAEVGRALTESFERGVVDREDIWVTSKLWNDAHAPENVRPALHETLSDLQLDTIDLYLIHWPVAQKPGVGMPQSPNDLISLQEQPLAETWSAMEDLVDDGLARHIGVSNFSIPKLRSLLADAERYAPEMNQIELHPYLQQTEMLSFAHANDVHLTAYSPLGSMDRPDAMKSDDEPILLEDETIASIANEHDATPAQVLISWGLHRGTAVIPKSVSENHIKENLAAAKVELTETDMQVIAKLDRGCRYVDGSAWTIGDSPYTMANLWNA
ncbi:MAG: aldo/keto reductase [Longimonas sp.]|uniref:aldo/keto reductase n=1 Tax=Longimonas sp. TaxID=2039626 RepID=UPI0039764FEA